MKTFLITLALVLITHVALAGERVTSEQRIIREAMAAGSCDGVQGITLRLEFSLEERKYTDQCWAAAQEQIVPRAMAIGSCEAVVDLPGIYPMGSYTEKRFVYHCWMDAGIRDLDSCIGMIEVGNKSSLSRILSVLHRNTPVSMGESGRLAILDTAGACIDAFAQINSLSAQRVRAKAAKLGPHVAPVVAAALAV